MAGLQSIDGLASNLNTTEIINAIITNERRPAVLMEAEQALKAKELSTFNALSAKLLALQTSIAGLNDSRSLGQASITLSNDGILDATADGLVGTGTYMLNVLSLAQNHQIASHGFDDPSQAIMGTGTITLALGSRSPVTLTIDSGNNSLVGIKNAINDANIGVTATIINDGSGSKPYRLILTGDQTGRQNAISVTSSLSGGLNLDFATSVFDAPELLSVSSQSTSGISLGATAAYTGTENKTYTFTVGGAGSQTVGTGNIVIDWTDGSQSGSLVVSQADDEVIGPDGLKLSFTDGSLTSGDVFQVTTFAPVLQQAADARVSIGSNAAGASPLVVSSATNELKDAISGVTLNLKAVTTDTTGPVTIRTGLNTDGIKKKIQSFIDAYNDVKDFIDEQNKFNADTKEAGVLLGDLTLMTIQSRLSRLVSQPVAGLDNTINTLSSIGIRIGTEGKLSIRDSARLTDALEDDFQAVLKLFVDGGSSTTDAISFIGAAKDVKGGTSFSVDITQAATRGYLQGQRVTDPALSGLSLSESNNRLKLRVDGIVSNEIVLSSRTYATGDELARELQSRINADEKIGKLGITVEWVDLGDDGYFKMTSGSYGSSSRVEIVASITNGAYATLGLAGDATMHSGDDVAGTINGEAATGKGQVLTGKEGNATTSGLKLRVTLTESQLGEGNEGTVAVTRGMASVFVGALDDITKTKDGVIARKTGGIQKQIDSIKQQIEDFDERLELRRESLTKKWAELETVLAQLQAEQSYLSSQLENINANFAQILGNT